MDIITDDILDELKAVHQAGISLKDYREVRRYAMTNDLMKLAGWLSWNGDDHYTVLYKTYYNLPVIQPPASLPDRKTKWVNPKPKTVRKADPPQAPKDYWVRLQKRIRDYEG